ncbi:hypothetical protein GmHk_14G040590 [Glycine max]|nr:hypothetical protein GmHk_14G040590 [Glycine max]
MAKKPVKGNFAHARESVPKHGSLSASHESLSMCTNPVAKITPAANAFAAAKTSASDSRNRRDFPTSGIAIPLNRGIAPTPFYHSSSS